MPGTSNSAQILLIRAWTASLAPFRAALRTAGLDARIHRVDIEPALNAALQRTTFDVVIYDPETPGITRDMLDARTREHRCFAPVLIFEPLDTLVLCVMRALADRWN